MATTELVKPIVSVMPRKSNRPSPKEPSLFETIPAAPAKPDKGKPDKGKPGKPGRSDKAQEAAKPAPPRAALAAPSKSRRTGESAESMAKRQREISVSEFFTKNRHLLGFDNPQKALLTTVKEAVDNALDACEEAAILPDLLVEISEV